MVQVEVLVLEPSALETRGLCAPTGSGWPSRIRRMMRMLRCCRGMYFASWQAGNDGSHCCDLLAETMTRKCDKGLPEESTKEQVSGKHSLAHKE